MKIDPNEPSMPTRMSFSATGKLTYEQVGENTIQLVGLTIRAELAARMTDDFLSLDWFLQKIIAGEPPMTEGDKEGWTVPHVNTEVVEYANWVAKGRAKWRVIQADALINALNEEK